MAPGNDDPFDRPQGDIVQFSAFEGLLTLVSPKEQRKLNTVNGEQNTILADVVLLEGEGPDGEQAPFEYRGVTIFGMGLVPTLARNIGRKPVLGVLGKSQNAKKGQKPAWVLLDPNDKQAQVARDYINSQSPFSTAGDES